MKPSSRDVLKIIGIGGIIGISMIAPTAPAAFNFISKEWKKYRRRDLGHIVRRFIKQEVVSISENNDKQVIMLTEKGKQRLLEYDFENLELKARKRDGLFRVVIFDIPEDKKKNREVFRRNLNDLGFTRLQDSVFVSAFPCKDEIDFICHYLNISKYVTLFSVKKVERGEELIFKKLDNFDTFA